MKLLEKKALWALSAQQVFEVGHKKAEMRKMRSASSLLISSPAISCFLADASTKSGKSDQHFQAAATASPWAGEEESSFLLALHSCFVSSPVTQAWIGGKI